MLYINYVLTFYTSHIIILSCHLRLVVDFDGTCTEHDTTPLLPRLAASFATRQRSSIAPESEDIHKQDLERRLLQFKQLEDEYMRLLGDTKTALFSSDTEEGEKEKSMHEVLHALDNPSTIVTKMVSESRVLEGLGHASSDELGDLIAVDHDVDVGDNKVVVRLRQGCDHTLARILLDNDEDKSKRDASCLGWSLAVLSINWCPNLIDAALIQPVLKKRRSILQIDACETEIPVWSNQVDGEGVVVLHVPGALAKRDRIVELRQHIQQRNESPESLIVYVGDSSTDLAALLEADIGIIMGQSKSTSIIAERWGVKIIPLDQRNQHGFDRRLGGFINKKSEKKILWQVDNWHEIDTLLIELDEHWS